MTHPIAKARLRPSICPTLPPVIMSDAITSVYRVIAAWMPVTVVPTSLATVAIDTFITELSSVMRNWADASVSRTSPEAWADRSVVLVNGTRACHRLNPGRWTGLLADVHRHRVVARGGVGKWLGIDGRLGLTVAVGGTDPDDVVACPRRPRKRPLAPGVITQRFGQSSNTPWRIVNLHLHLPDATCGCPRHPGQHGRAGDRWVG